MHKTLQHIIYYFAILMTINLSTTNIIADTSHNDLRKFGDVMQIANPIIAFAISSQEKGIGHFAIIYASNLGLAYGIKYTGKSSKWSMSKRPHTPNKRDRYDGMPSAHTMSAWSGASYLRVFGNDYKYISIPLYMTAIVTGYSRIQSKEHTTTQVITGAVLSEIITILSDKMQWSNDYRAANISIGPDGASANIKIRF